MSEKIIKANLVHMQGNPEQALVLYNEILRGGQQYEVLVNKSIVLYSLN